jgi:cytochrome c553
MHSMTKGRFPLQPGRRGIVFLALSGILVWACGGTLPPPTSTDVKAASARWPGTTLEQLSSGRRGYLKKCGTCHSLKSETSVPREVWEATVNRMRSKNGAELSDEEVADIARYLYAMESR